MSDEIKVGSVVTLKSSDEPKMTVESVSENIFKSGQQDAFCTWFNSKTQEFLTKSFNIEILKLIE